MMKSFIKRVKHNKNLINSFINKKIKSKKKIFLYGASTKGNTVLQYYGLDAKKIPFAAERSPFKWGKYTIGTGIKIISEAEAKKNKPNQEEIDAILDKISQSGYDSLSQHEKNTLFKASE